MTPHTPRPLLRRLAIGALLALFACVGAGALGIWWLGGAGLLGDNRENLTNEEIQRFAAITIPPSATNVHARTGGFQEPYVHARFDIPAGDLQSFLDQNTTRYMPALGPGAPDPFVAGLTPERPWWQPSAATRFLSGQNQVDGIRQAVLIDMTDPAIYIVYVQTGRLDLP